MLKPGHILILALVAAAGTLLAIRLLKAVSVAAERERAGACLALAPDNVQEARKAPDFALPDLRGKKRRLSDYRGKVVLLSFWATWCPPCVEELPSLARLQSLMKGEEGFVLLIVSVDDSAKAVRAFFEKHGAPVGPEAVLIDPSRKVPASFGTVKFPETYLIDRSGLVRHRFINKRDWSGEAALQCLRSQM
jgi:peroxiredoxin